ncbi:hypothetical protein V1477_000327 [Vespula maculifrons]|uniref:Uncharacterized protein n=1 Tax=Vespula maculifrons TaxID=7453 RepID=A0ABD2D2K8_VESMC
MEGSKSKKVTVASVACSCYEATGGRESSDAADGDGGGSSAGGGGSGGGGAGAGGGGGCRGGGRVGGGRGGIGGGGRRRRGGKREGKEEKEEVEDKYINKRRREKALEDIFWRLFVRCGPVGKSSSAQQEEKPRLIQYRPGVHQASVAKVLSTPPNSGSFSPTSHPPLTPLDERFAGAVVGLTVNSRGRAQCSACRIKRKTNVNYGQSSLLITVRSQCEDKSKENRRVIQRSLGNPIPSASKEFVNVHEETSPVPALEFKCERICTHALTRPRPSTIAVNGLTSARAELRPTCAN